MLISLAFTGGRQRPAVVHGHLIGVPGSSHSPERDSGDWLEALNSHTIKVNANFMQRWAIKWSSFSLQWCVLGCINTHEDSSLTPGCESEDGDFSGHTWVVFQGPWAHFLNSLQMAGSNRIMGRSGGRRGREGAGFTGWAVNPPLADPQGDVTEWDNASRCGPDDYEAGGGVGGSDHLQGLIRVSNGRKVATPAGEKSPSSHTEKCCSVKEAEQLSSFLGNTFSLDVLSVVNNKKHN